MAIYNVWNFIKCRHCYLPLYLKFQFIFGHFHVRYNINLTLGCLRFYNLVPLPVLNPVYTIKAYTKIDQRKLCQSYPIYTKFDQSFYPKLPFSVKLKNKRNGWIRSWFRKDVLIGQFPSKSVKVFRKIGWVSIPSKSIKVFHEGGGHNS